jgi:uncharacterized YccA/Bax inhibitor family protein
VLNAAAFERGMTEVASAERTGMTVAGTYVKTGLLLILLIMAAAYGWSQVQIVQVGGQDVALPPTWTWILVFATLGVGIFASVAVRAAAVLGPLYSICEGTLLGIIARYYNLEYSGIVLQAIVATIAVFVATLALYNLHVLKVGGRLVRFVMVGLAAVALIWLVAWLLSLFGIYFQFLYAPTPFGIALSLLIVIIGVLNLPLNFAFIDRAAGVGSPRFMEWYAAYGLMLALIWMYISILRLLAIVRR